MRTVRAGVAAAAVVFAAAATCQALARQLAVAPAVLSLLLTALPPPTWQSATPYQQQLHSELGTDMLMELPPLRRRSAPVFTGLDNSQPRDLYKPITPNDLTQLANGQPILPSYMDRSRPMDNSVRCPTCPSRPLQEECPACHIGNGHAVTSDYIGLTSDPNAAKAPGSIGVMKVK
ncbi:hypothetical protein HK405_014022 [Cladochytrium tenue]|nr:hypothetical protein HK405_014022 [Cladochytrium tenue]